ncbi:MAG: S1 RNA-binding domain-containing protein, partial [Deltaproteobacteria bacterium]
KDLSQYAPKIITFNINPEKIRDLIGPGGKHIRGIIAETGVKIDVDDSGVVNIFSSSGKAAEDAIKRIKDLTKEAEVGKIYLGIVKKIMDFGAFVEILPGTDGLVHISQLDDRHVKNVKDILAEGDEVHVKVIGIDQQGRIKLSRKAAMNEQGDTVQK